MKSYLAYAARIAKGGAERNFKLGCVAKRKDGAVVTSRNERTRVPNPAAHAEVRVLRKVDYGATIWIARVTNDGTWTMAKPCARCQAFIVAKGVYRVYYTVGPGEYGVWYPGKTELKDFKKEQGLNSASWIAAE